ncbi:MAG TPA: G5 domain-containing protein, partial [Pseudonocardiaceae bacterium]
RVTERVPLPPSSHRIEDGDMNMSRQVVEDPGTPGVQDVTFAVATVNGMETGRIPVATSWSRRHVTPWCAWAPSRAPMCPR